jgi:hypothetical protein
MSKLILWWSFIVLELDFSTQNLVLNGEPSILKLCNKYCKLVYFGTNIFFNIFNVLRGQICHFGLFQLCSWHAKAFGYLWSKPAWKSFWCLYNNSNMNEWSFGVWLLKTCYQSKLVWAVQSFLAGQPLKVESILLQILSHALCKYCLCQKWNLMR